MTGSVSVEGGFVVIRIPLDDAHSFCVALDECPCRATKSTATSSIRVRIKLAIGRAIEKALGKPRA